MEDVKKRKLDETAFEGGGCSSVDELRSMLEPIAKPQLVNLLAKLGTQYPSIAEEIRAISTSDPIHRKLFVRGLAWNTTSETLCDAFQVHGEIEEGAVIYDKATGKSRGYGFITYKNGESTKNALRAPSKMIDGRLAVCNLACEGQTGSVGTPDLAQRKLFIAGLSPEITSEMLLNYFARNGEIEEGSVAYDKDTDLSRGFGFVTYKTAEAAKRAIDDPEKTLGGRTILVKYADSHPRGKTTTVPMQVPLGMVSVGAMASMAAGIGYLQQQAGKGYPGMEPSISGYPYLQLPMVSPYPWGTYPSPPGTAGAAPFIAQLPISQVHDGLATKKEQFGVAPTSPMGMGPMGGAMYPYCVHKQ